MHGIPRRIRGRLVVALLGVGVALWLGVAMLGSAMAETWWAGGQAEHLWVVVEDTGVASSDQEGGGGGGGGGGVAVKLLHRGPGDPAGELHLVERLSGRLASPAGGGGVVTSGDAAWLTYRGGAVQRVDASSGDLQGQWRFNGRMEAGLPEGFAARSIALVDGTLWALVHAQTPAAMQALLDTQTHLTPNPTASTASTQPSAPTASAGPAVAGLDALLTMRGSRWEVAPIPLPDRYSHEGEAWLMGESGAAMGTSGGLTVPLLLTRKPPSQGAPEAEAEAAAEAEMTLLTASRWTPAGWESERYSLRRGDGVQAAMVDGLLVVAERVSQTGAGVGVPRIEVSVLERGETTAVGVVDLPVQASSGWAMVPEGGGVLLLGRKLPGAEAGAVGASGEGAAAVPLTLTAVRLDLRGKASEPFDYLEAPAAGRPVADYVVLVAVSAVAVLVLLIFWRRNPRRHVVRLPDTLRTAPLSQRLLAGLIDLMPVLFVVSRAYGISMRELLSVRWPSAVAEAGGRSWEVIEPSCVAIGVFTLYTLVFELIFRWTPGKRLARLRVTDLRGGRGTWMQVVGRNLLKPLDLVAQVLLLLPVVLPSRQRLGDLLARTVVVAPIPADGEATQEDADRDKQGDADGEEPKPSNRTTAPPRDPFPKKKDRDVDAGERVEGGGGGEP